MPLAHAHGGPVLTGALRVSADDFQVDETLGFQPEGSGEHVFLDIEKRGANTEWVARSLASALRLSPVAIGYSGLKDRHAVTRQMFSVHLPGKADPDWSALAIEGVRILSATRHPRKLKRGAHAGNRFVIVLRDVAGDRDAAGRMAQSIRRSGVPNYFGEQRFGRNGDNLRLAERLFAGARLGRSERGFALSAARALVFNEVLCRRVSDGTWNRALDGDVWMLAGTHSIFGPQEHDDEIERRLAQGDIDPTGPMWGRGELRSARDTRGLEQEQAQRHAVYTQGLERAELSHERRSLRLRVDDLQLEWLPDDALRLAFSLRSGAFATVVVGELCNWHQRSRDAGSDPTAAKS